MNSLYTFTEKKTKDVLADGRIFIYFEEKEKTEKVSTENETIEYPIWQYRRIEMNLPLTKENIVNSIIRQDFSQADVEAIFRHKLAGDDNGEFDLFNEFAENTKLRADEILNDQTSII